MKEKSDHADSVEDDYAERVLRNEGRLEGLEKLVAETRESDRKLIEQRSDSLALELERRAEALFELVNTKAQALLDLSKEERGSDRREVALITAEAEKRATTASILLREVYDVAIKQNYEQSREAITALEHRSTATTEKLEQMVRQWRDSDREARELFANELARHLDALNHNNERMREFQANSVTRELWTSEKEAAIKREGLLRDQIIAIDRLMLTMTPNALSDKSHAEILARMEATVTAASQVLDNKIGVVSDKVAELKSYRDTTMGRSSGYSATYAWAATAITIMISIIVLANTFLR